MKDSLAIEGSSSAYGNILAVKEGNENSDAIKALKAALESQQVADFINEKYDGAVVSTVDEPRPTAMTPPSTTTRSDRDDRSPSPPPPPPTPRSWRLPRRSWPRRTSPWTSRSYHRLCRSPTPSWRAASVDANYFQHTARIWRTSTPRTAPTSSSVSDDPCRAHGPVRRQAGLTWTPSKSNLKNRQVTPAQTCRVISSWRNAHDRDSSTVSKTFETAAGAGGGAEGRIA